jgi:undecaprenyl-diphosphatase
VLHQANLSADGWYVLAIGLVTSSLASFVAIWGLMHWLEKFSTWPLVIYRALFGVALIVQTLS